MCVSPLAPMSASVGHRVAVSAAEMMFKLNLECEHKLADQVHNLILLEAWGVGDVLVQLHIDGVVKEF